MPVAAPQSVAAPQTMKELFQAFYRPSQQEYDELFGKCLLTADANVLLDFYRVRDETREKLFKIFEAFGDRLWVPHQAALEYQRNRIKVRHDQAIKAASVKDELAKVQGQVSNLLQGNKNHAFLDSERWLGQVNSIFAEITESINNGLSSYPEVSSEDPIQEKITALIGSKVGQPYKQSDYEKYINEAKSRFAKDIPPGFADEKNKEKVGDRKYGDYILWRQILDKAKQERLPVVFVSRDLKEDWVQEVGRKKIGPLPELVDEMLREAGVRFYAYETFHFIDTAGESLGIDVAQETISELENLPSKKPSTDLNQLKRLIESHASGLDFIKQNPNPTAEGYWNEMANFGRAYKRIESELENLSQEEAWYLLLLFRPSLADSRSNLQWVDRQDIIEHIRKLSFNLGS